MQHFTWEGKEKVAYDTPPSRKGMRSYQCDVCGKFHLAKSNTNRKKYKKFLRG